MTNKWVILMRKIINMDFELLWVRTGNCTTFSTCDACQHSVEESDKIAIYKCLGGTKFDIGCCHISCVKCQDCGNYPKVYGQIAHPSCTCQKIIL